MQSIRRSAFRAISSSSPCTSFVAAARPISSAAPFVARSKIQSSLANAVLRRAYSDEASERPPQAVGEQSTPVSSNAADSASSEGYSRDSYQREQRPRYDNYRGGDRGGYGGDRGGYGGDRGASRYGGNRGGDRGGYGGDRGGRPPMAPREVIPSEKVYIGNLLFDVTAKDIQREFEQFGTVKDATIATDARGLSKGFAYVEFETVEQATAAIQGMHQKVLEGRRLIVNYQTKTSVDRPSNPPSKTLFIGNLAFEMSDADLNKLFRDVKNVIDVRVAIDRRTGQPRGFAHADFVDTESATKGKEALMNKEVYGRKLRVDFSAGSRESRGNSEAPRY